MVCSIGSVFIDPSSEFGEGHAQYLFILLGKGKVLVKIVHGYGEVRHESLVYQRLISVGIESAHTDHIYLGTQMSFDQPGQKGQLSGKSVFLICYLILSAFISFMDLARIFIG